MKFTISGIIVILFVAMIYSIDTRTSRPISIIVQKRPTTPSVPIVELPALVQEINKHNARINTYICDNVVIKGWEKGIKVRLTGRMFYEKSAKFRMFIESRFGTELDLGSNDEWFWYWSKRDKRPSLYYATHEDYKKTRLKTPFNPDFIRQSLGLEVLGNDGRVLESEDVIVMQYRRWNSMNEPVLFQVFIDKSQKRVTGTLITTPDGKPLASSEIQAFENGLPSQMLYMWYEEGKTVQFDLSHPRANTTISGDKWTMPSYQPRINMADE